MTGRIFEGAAERVARTIDRRTLFRRAAQAAFVAVGAVAAGGGFQSGTAFATGCINCSGSCPACSNCECCDTECHTSFGFCQPSFCNGSNCGSACSYDRGDEWPDTACWCTGYHCYHCTSPASSYCGHYRCCDCYLCGPNNVKCSCRSFVYTCPTSLAGVEVAITADTDLNALTAQLAPPGPNRPVCCG